MIIAEKSPMQKAAFMTTDYTFFQRFSDEENSFIMALAFSAVISEFATTIVGTQVSIISFILP